MAHAAKRVANLQEFAAHAGNVNCVAMGHDSGRVLVSGGEDRKVNLWAVGKTSCILSLSGHTSPVEAVRFRPDEKAVMAGSLSGAVKIWDLEAVKILRTLSGHKAAIRCFDYHPFNDFLITGSMDTNIKVWDMRRKSCLYTYSGHTNSVNCIRFSPDGQWMASGGEDGLVKLWDMSAGKQLAVFRQHTGPVNSVQFHPNDLLLASGSSDRTVKFWDLEEMQMVGSTDGDSAAVRCLLFHPRENCLYSAGANFLKVYGWEPSVCFDSLAVGWVRPADIATVDTQLVGISYSQDSLSTFVVDIQNVQPLGGPPYQQSSNIPPQSTTSVHRRRSFIAEKPLTQCGPMKISEEETANPGLLVDEESEDGASGIEISDMTEYKHVFRPRRELSRDPVLDLESFSSAAEEKKLSNTSVTKQGHRRRKSSQGANPQRDESPLDFQSVASSRQQPPLPSTHAYNAADNRIKRPPTSCTKTRNNAETKRENARTTNKRLLPDESTFDSKSRPNRQNSEDRGVPVKDKSGTQLPLDDVSDLKERSVPFRENADIPRFGHLKISEDSSTDADRMGFKARKPSPEQNEVGSKSSSCRVDVGEFLPKSSSVSGDIADSAAVESISNGHDALIAVLSARHRNLLVIKTMWIAGNIKTALDSAVGMNDQAVLHDVINMMLQKASSWTLDHCTSLLPILGGLISSRHDNYFDTGLSGIKLLLRSFAPIIKANITAPPSVGVDISREERAGKCLSCHKELMKIRSELDRKSGMCIGQRSLHFKEIQLLMSQLD